MDEAALRRWVEGETGRAVTRLEPLGAGASRATFAVELAGTAPPALVLRAETGVGPLAGTPLTLAREAAVYRALAKTEVPAPALVAAHPSGEALLLERAPGVAELSALAEPERRAAVAERYFRALAALHSLPARDLDLPGFAAPKADGDALRLEVAAWRAIHAARVDADLPPVETAFAWLDAHAPPDAARVALCHGDAGPGNFLFDPASGRVTALLDWEFAHLGDPHDDLAWVHVRAHLLGGFGDLAAGMRTWSAAAGLPAEPARLAVYRALVLARMAVACAAALAPRDAAGAPARRGAAGAAPAAAVYRLLLPYLLWLLPQALRAAGCDDPALASQERAGREALEAVPTLRDHARPLAELELA